MSQVYSCQVIRAVGGLIDFPQGGFGAGFLVRMCGMIATILSLALAASPAEFSGKFNADGIRVEESSTGWADAKSFRELATIAINGTGDIRQQAAQRSFSAFERYTAPLNVQFPKCHCGRTFDGIRKWDYARQITPKPSALTSKEQDDFKAACYFMLKSEIPWIRERAMEHLVIVADHRDLSKMLGLLRTGEYCGLACLALGRIGSDDALPALERELSGPFKEQAQAAIEHIRGEPEPVRPSALVPVATGK